MEIFMIPKAIIFDLDGTLMHTLPDIHASVNAMLSREGYPLREYEHTVYGLNKGARYLIAHALPDGASDSDIDRALATYSEEYALHCADSSEPFDGTDEMILDLLAAEYRLAVLSNKPDEFTKKLTSEAFGNSFDPVLGQGKYKTKPSPEAPLAIAAGWGLTPDEVVFVGDSDIDMMTAKAAGMRAVGVEWGYRDPSLLLEAGAEKLAKTPAELFKIIKSLT